MFMRRSQFNEKPLRSDASAARASSPIPPPVSIVAPVMEETVVATFKIVELNDAKFQTLNISISSHPVVSMILFTASHKSSNHKNGLMALKF